LSNIAANQTLTSGKLNEVVDLFIRQIERFPPSGRHNRRIETQPSFGARWLRFFHSTFDAREDQLAGGTSFARGCLAQTEVQIGRKIDAGAD